MDKSSWLFLQTGQLNEYTERKEMSSEVVCMALGRVPVGEQRCRFLAVGLSDNTVRIISLDPSVSTRIEHGRFKFAVPYRISCNTYIYIYWKNTCEPRKEYLIFTYHLDIHYDYFILILLLWWWEKLFKFFIFTGLFIAIKYASIARAVRVSVYCRDGRNRGQGGNRGAWHSWGIVSQHWSTGQCKKNQLD